MLGGDIVNELEHVHGLAHTRAPEETHLPAFGEGTHEIDDLDAGLEELSRRRKLLERRRVAVDRHPYFGGYGPPFVDRAAEDIHDAPQRRWSDRDRDTRTRILRLHAAPQALGAAEADRTHDAVADLLLDLEGEIGTFERQRIVDLGQLLARELDIDHRADALHHRSFIHARFLNADSSMSLRSSRPYIKLLPRRRRSPKAPW